MSKKRLLMFFSLYDIKIEISLQKIEALKQ